MRLDQGEQGDGGIGVGFVLLAYGIAHNVFLHKLCKAWPLELSSNELASLEISQMTGSFMVMTVGEDDTVEGVVLGK